MNKKKYYLIYQVTNNVNGKIYIGMHETNDLEDNYMGSGKILNKAKEKYGLENFTFKVLMYLQNREEMCLLEHCVVTPEFCAREDVYNIKEGGDGGWDYVNLSSDFAIGTEKRRKQFHAQGGIESQKRFKENHNGMSFTRYTIDNMTNEEYEKFCQKRSESVIKYWQENPNKKLIGEKNPMFGKKVSDQIRKRISNAMKTDANNMKNTHWYVNFELQQCIPIKDGSEIPKGFVLGRVEDFDKYFVQLEQQEKIKREKQQKRNARIQEVQEMADCYQEFGFAEVQKRFPNSSGIGSPSALIHLFERWGAKYTPQQGVKRPRK